MKKLLLSLTILLSISNSFAQESKGEFPYSKMLKMTPNELIEANFKFNSNKNQYFLTKLNGLNATTNVLGAFSGTPTNYIPHVNDYVVVIQNGEKQVSYINVTFYDSELYHNILTFAVDKGEKFLETNSGALNKTQFNYSGYSFELSSKRTGQTASSTSYGAAVTKDQSYNTYTFLIMTGIDPVSEWHEKQAKKEKKREEKGRKKQSAADLM